MPKDIPAHHVYCDEAYLQHEYRVQGGVWVHRDSIRSVKLQFSQLRAKHPWLKEMKWTGVTGNFVHQAYLDALEVFFAAQRNDDVRFNCIVVKDEEDPSFGGDSLTRDLGFRKAYWTLLRHRLGDGDSHHITLDQKACKTEDPDRALRDRLNRQLRGYDGAPAVLSCKSASSASDDLLQLADLLCGAVGWAWNQRPSKSEAKRIFVAEIEAFRGRRLDMESKRFDSSFNIWRYRQKRRTS